MIRVMRDGAIGLIFVWAFEDNKSVRRHKLTVLDGNEQDVLVPWSMNEFSGFKKSETKIVEIESEIQDEKSDDFVDGKQKRCKIEKDDDGEIKDGGESFQRYYHLFKKGELDELVIEAGGKLIESGYDRDNWYIKFQK